MPVQQAAVSSNALQITATPLVPMPPKFPTRPDLPQVTLENVPRTGIIQVIVELAEPPAAALLASLGAGASPAVADWLARTQTLLVLSNQHAVLEALTSAPIEALVLSRTGMLVNTIAVQVDAGKIDLIRQIPGVKGVSVVVIAFPDVQKPEGEITHPDGQKDVVAPQNQQDQQGGGGSQ